MNSYTVIIIAVIVIFIVLAFVFSTYTARRSLRQVLKILRDNQALTPETAKLPQELGFKKQAMIQMGVLRDHKPAAIQLLMNSEVIKQTDEGKLYLSEGDLLRSGIEKKLGG
jgi:hypothetical protein